MDKKSSSNFAALISRLTKAANKSVRKEPRAERARNYFEKKEFQPPLQFAGFDPKMPLPRLFES